MRAERRSPADFGQTVAGFAVGLVAGSFGRLAGFVVCLVVARLVAERANRLR